MDGSKVLNVANSSSKPFWKTCFPLFSSVPKTYQTFSNWEVYILFSMIFHQRKLYVLNRCQFLKFLFNFCSLLLLISNLHYLPSQKNPLTIDIYVCGENNLHHEPFGDLHFMLCDDHFHAFCLGFFSDFLHLPRNH